MKNQNMSEILKTAVINRAIAYPRFFLGGFAAVALSWLIVVGFVGLVYLVGDIAEVHFTEASIAAYETLPVETREALRAEAGELKLEEHKEDIKNLSLDSLVKLEKMLEEDLQSAK